MKTEKCIIKLTFVPDRIVQATDGDIAENMYLLRSAIKPLLKGNMFSGLDCRWTIAEQIDINKAEKAVRHLLKLGFVAQILYVR